MQTQSDKPALQVMVIQNGIVKRFQETMKMVGVVRKAVETARQHNITVLIAKEFPQQADVLTVDAWIYNLRSNREWKTAQGVASHAQ
jgi:hypothetical protein